MTMKTLSEDRVNGIIDVSDFRELKSRFDSKELTLQERIRALR